VGRATGVGGGVAVGGSVVAVGGSVVAVAVATGAVSTGMVIGVGNSVGAGEDEGPHPDSPRSRNTVRPMTAVVRNCRRVMIE